jgi:hypothetical protein
VGAEEVFGAGISFAPLLGGAGGGLKVGTHGVVQR